MSLFNLSVKHRLFLLAAIAVIGLFVIGIIVSSSIKTIDVLESTRTKLSDMQVSLLTLRRHEKDYLARIDGKYVERFESTLKSAFTSLMMLST